MQICNLWQSVDLKKKKVSDKQEMLEINILYTVMNDL
jgi:hypothetical protein